MFAQTQKRPFDVESLPEDFADLKAVQAPLKRIKIDCEDEKTRDSLIASIESKHIDPESQKQSQFPQNQKGVEGNIGEKPLLSKLLMSTKEIDFLIPNEHKSAADRARSLLPAALRLKLKPELDCLMVGVRMIDKYLLTQKGIAAVENIRQYLLRQWKFDLTPIIVTKILGTFPLHYRNFVDPFGRQVLDLTCSKNINLQHQEMRERLIELQKANIAPSEATSRPNRIHQFFPIYNRSKSALCERASKRPSEAFLESLRERARLKESQLPAPQPSLIGKADVTAFCKCVQTAFQQRAVRNMYKANLLEMLVKKGISLVQATTLLSKFTVQGMFLKESIVNGATIISLNLQAKQIASRFIERYL